MKKLILPFVVFVGLLIEAALSSHAADITVKAVNSYEYVQRAEEEVDLASATTTTLNSIKSQNIRITGTTTITSFGVAPAGMYKRGRFSGALQLTHSANLILPGSANFTTSANDRWEAFCISSGTWLVKLDKADGTAVAGGAGSGDVVGQSSSVDGEIALFSGTGGKTIKRATTTGILKGTSGVISAATAEVDYVTPSGSGTLANKTLTAPTIASMANANHNHQNSAGGGTLDTAAIGAGTLPIARGGTAAGTANGALDSLITAEATVASASTTDLGAVTSQNVQITGTTTITSFGTATAGIKRHGRFAGALTLTHNATSLILPSGASITTAANDRFYAISLGSGNWFVYFYQRASGAPLVAGTPPGSDTHVLFNDGGAFGADAGMTYNKTTDTLTLAGGLNMGSSGSGTITIGSAGATISTANNGDIIFAGIGNGTDEDLKIDLNSANVATISSSTGVATVNYSGISLQSGGVAIPTVSSTDSLTNKKLSHSTLATDDTYTGIDLTGLNNSGGVTQWDAVYLNSSSQWVLADANGSGTFPCRGLAVATVATANATTVILRGVVRNDAWTWTPGGDIYLSTTAGGLTQTAPSTTGDTIQKIGFAIDADTMFLDPELSYAVK